MSRREEQEKIERESLLYRIRSPPPHSLLHDLLLLSSTAATTILPLLLLCIFGFQPSSTAIEILSKSKLECCVKTSGSDNLSCEKKIVINKVVPSSSSGGEASIIAELVEVEENDMQKMQIIRVAPIITINKSVAYALYELSYPANFLSLWTKMLRPSLLWEHP